MITAQRIVIPSWSSNPYSYCLISSLPRFADKIPEKILSIFFKREAKGSKGVGVKNKEPLRRKVVYKNKKREFKTWCQKSKLHLRETGHRGDSQI